MKIKYLLLPLLFLGVLSCTKETLPVIGSDDDGRGNYLDSNDAIPGWIRIKLTEEALPLRVGVFTRGAAESGNERIDEVAAMFGATEIKRVFRDGGKFAERRRKYGFHLWYDVKIDESVPVSRAGKAFANVEGVELVEPIVKTVLSDYIIVPDISDNKYNANNVSGVLAGEAAPFNDPLLSKQWNYYNDGSLGQTLPDADNNYFVPGADINVFPLWREGNAGKPEVIVAVMDGGIQTDHPDLAANIWVNKGEIPGDGIDNDNNGYIDDIYGWNVTTQSGIITPQAHGTHVAGTVAAVNNNGTGVCGVAGGSGKGDGVRLMSCQAYVTLSNGSTGGSVEPELFLYAADNGAVIAQNSWVYTGVMPASMKKAILYFIETAGFDKSGNQTGPMKGGVVCFAAGNSNSSTVAEPSSMDEVVCVTSIDANYEKSAYSNFGKDANIIAPGGARVLASEYATNPRQLYSTSINGGYAYMFGTSMACPHVSGIAALIVSNYGVGQRDFTAEQCKKILLSSYRPIGGYVDYDYVSLMGVGLIDAAMIMQKATQKSPDKPTVSFATDHDKVTVKLNIIADGNSVAILKIHIGYAKQNAPTDVVETTFINTKPVGQLFEHTFNLIGSVKYNFSISVEDRYGNLSDVVEGEATPLPHINVPPTANWMDNVSMKGTDAKDKKSIDISRAFSDRDIPYGDYLTYAFEQSAPEYVTITLEGNTMTFEPIYIGESEVVVTATDSHGESATKAFLAKVLKGNTKPDRPETDFDVAKAVMSIAPNPVDDNMSIIFTHLFSKTGQIKIYDSAGRELINDLIYINTDGKCFVNVWKLSPGTYTAVCNVLEREFKKTFVKK